MMRTALRSQAALFSFAAQGASHGSRGGKESMATRELPQAQAAPTGLGLSGRDALIPMIGIALVILLSALDQTIVATALPSVIAELQGFELYAWVATSYLLTSTVMVPVMGKLGDLYGRKPFLMAAIVIFVGASAMAGASTSMLFLIISRAIQGIGAGMLQATAFASVGDMFPQPERRARWQGVTTGTFGLASVFGPSLGGVMTDHLGWRSVFYVNLPIGILAIVMIWMTLPANLSPRAAQARIDWGGTATIVAAISALLLAVEWGGSAYAWASPQIIGLLAVALLAFAGFFIIERRVPEPLMPLDLFGNRIIALCSAISLLLGFALFALTFYIPLFAQGALAMSASSAGALLTPLVAFMAVGSLTSGQIFARVGRFRTLMLVGAGLLLVGTFLITQVSTQVNTLLLGAELALCGIGVGLQLPMLTVIVQSSVPRSRLGVSTAMVQFLRLMGSTLSTAVVGALVSGVFVATLAASAPAGTDARLLSAFHDPQALVSEQTRAELSAVAQQLGPDGPTQLAQLIAQAQDALAVGIRTGFMVSLASAVLILILVLMIDERAVQRQEPMSAADLPLDSGAHAL
ncbi:MFS transporter [Chloroflexia bacterium SDU3-3]|nr:MFS transporter [Chloroflexia bacterium SDU3-3]